MKDRFELVSKYQPQGDQPQAIEKLVKGIQEGRKHQTLLGATGTGKTFTVSNLIKEVNKPTLVIAHNKTLAGQLYSEFKEFFPEQRCRVFCQLLRLLSAGGVRASNGYFYRERRKH